MPQQVLKNSTALAAALEPQSASTPDISVPKPPKVAKSTKPDEEQARAEDAPVQQAVAMGEHNPEAKKQESILEGQWPDVEEGNAQDHPRHESSEPRRPSEEEGVKSKPTSKLELLVELLRSFRGGMLRVDSNLRAAMFRAVRYLVRNPNIKTYLCLVAVENCTLYYSYLFYLGHILLFRATLVISLRARPAINSFDAVFRCFWCGVSQM